jgi:hypothetical protein
VSEPIAEITYRGDIQVRPYRRGTYLGGDHLETLVERALADRYSYGGGWHGYAVISIAFHDRQPPDADEQPSG